VLAFGVSGARGDLAAEVCCAFAGELWKSLRNQPFKRLCSTRFVDAEVCMRSRHDRCSGSRRARTIGSDHAKTCGVTRLCPHRQSLPDL
jgi:hypothetical protein